MVKATDLKSVSNLERRFESYYLRTSNYYKLLVNCLNEICVTFSLLSTWSFKMVNKEVPRYPRNIANTHLNKIDEDDTNCATDSDDCLGFE